MATLYEILGVAPTASRAEIRAGYLKRARKHHPDQFADQPHEQHRAERRMQRINEAWTTLNDPTRRAQYDLTLRVPPGVTYGPSTAAPRPRAAAPRPPDPPRFDPYDVDPISVDEGDIGLGTWLLRLLPMFILLGILGLILVVTAFAGGPTEPNARLPTPEAVEDLLRIGDCVLIAEAREVPCDFPNDGKIEAFVQLGAACPSAIGRSYQPIGTDVLMCVVPA